jgi:hypothetical protein
MPVRTELRFSSFFLGWSSGNRISRTVGIEKKERTGHPEHDMKNAELEAGQWGQSSQRTEGIDIRDMIERIGQPGQDN